MNQCTQRTSNHSTNNIIGVAYCYLGGTTHKFLAGSVTAYNTSTDGITWSSTTSAPMTGGGVSVFADATGLYYFNLYWRY